MHSTSDSWCLGSRQSCFVWLQGKSVCDHLAKRFLKLEDDVAGNYRSYTLPLTARRQDGSVCLSSKEVSQQLDAGKPHPS